MSDSDSEFKIDLCSDWAIRRDGETQALAVNFPADIHSVLLAADRIEDPYWRDNETSLDWIHESEWIATRPFDMPDLVDDQYVLTLSGVDCQSIVSLNGKPVGELGNCFRRYDLDITDALASGPNLLQIRFLSNSAVAREKADAFPFSVPYIHWNNRLAHYNFLRKPQCDAGWDWNIALSPLGVYGEIALRKVDAIDLIDTAIRQHHSNQHVVVEVDLHTHVQSAIQAIASLEIGEQRIEESVDLYPDYCKTTLALKIDNPRLWWPVGHGAQAMYNASIQIGNQRREFKIGLRQVELITDSDAIGHRFAFRINGCEIFMRGANWISADALPSGATRAVVADLLDSAIDANMNMLRVWGGGTYQPDWFYEMCSERGLMIWQDFMFACNLYPAADRNWLNEVRTEAQQQVRRLSAYPCLTLWCGDNELVGAINWFEESKHDRDRYLAMYDRLNYALQETVEDEAIGVPWWPSSPCSGLLNFGDGWHDDTTGDMHFWDVWHAAKDFQHYRTVQPRFCSEFGFQSLPSAALIETFTEAHDRNVSSPVMDVHQRNAGGNSRIVETLARYFRFPEGFTEMCWLSQVSQALAMKTAIECWRSSKPRCMGTLFWQLNDTWPVASWSSIEYGGAWKLTQYLARRFYAPILAPAELILPDRWSRLVTGHVHVRLIAQSRLRGCRQTHSKPRNLCICVGTTKQVCISVRTSFLHAGPKSLSLRSRQSVSSSKRVN
jgi:beta-mannosidase